jgi:hypothetical protein
MTEPCTSDIRYRAAGARPIDPLAYPPLLESAEAKLVVGRRCRTESTDDLETVKTLPADTIGFGLSGGGVRSATFCLGVFQALARAKSLKRIDYLSTVSGGGYFGTFLGRLFTREWVAGVDDVERVLVGNDPVEMTLPGTTVPGPDSADPAPHAGWGAQVFRWLRDNGRYLAPRGSGDVLLLGALLLRNWIAVQLVLVVSVLTIFCALQLVGVGLERVLARLTPAVDIPLALVCSMPLGNSLLWWSAWSVTPLMPFLLVATPAGWAYWFVRRNTDGPQGVPAVIGAVITLGIAALGTAYYGFFHASHPHRPRLAVCAVVALVAVIAIFAYRFGEHRAELWRKRTRGTSTESGNLLRTRLTNHLKSGLIATGLLSAWALVDTVGGTLYAASSNGQLAQLGAAVVTVFGSVGAFARPLAVLLTPKRKGRRPGITVSTLSWIAAVVVMAVWFVAINVGSHAVRWKLGPAAGVPFGMRQKPPSTPILGADKIVVDQSGGRSTITAALNEPPACALPFDGDHSASWFLVISAAVLASFSWLFARTRTFVNLSSVHGFYAARLTRTFLGASNERRLGRSRTAVSEATEQDDCRGSAYWQWPLPRGARMQRTTDIKAKDPVSPWSKGGPLHIINTTVNETLDSKSGIQNQDRKGTSLAVGPCCLSLGVRHHLLHTARWTRSFPAARSAHRVFSRFRSQPEWLSLGRWMSISGAAFSAAAGANTTVPVAILTGMFNVRLGYWWDSGTEPKGQSWISRLFPVQTALFAEMLARTPGTARRLWNLSDGGHFENMAGYELIRRRLPIIVIIDAEADPDYSFQGLSDLVRKARLDFQAEISFMNAFDLDGVTRDGTGSMVPPPLPDRERRYFGDLDSLRRGVWTSEDLTNVYGRPDRRFTLEPDRTRPSKAHAALARVIYGDPHDGDAPRSWLVYVKATLMGDEPEDVCHYHRGHPDFPQETTLDQFFDEAQWESYRRLGQHVAHRVLTPELFQHLVNNPA